jgi:polyhydroxybutyrate depolymerase
MRKGMKAWLRWTICLVTFAGLVMPYSASSALMGSDSAITQNTSQPGDSVQTITVGGVQRTFRLHIPPAYDGSTPWPLVFVLHGAGGSGKSMEQLTGFSAKADAEKFIVVYPNGTGNPQMWATGMSPHPYSTADDVGFIRALLNKLEHDLKIDHKRIYSCGFSMGGMMTYRLGAEMSGTFAAIGVASGTIGTKQPDGTVYEITNPAHPLPLIAFHGKQDHTVGYDGNGTYAGNPDYVLPVATSIAFWVNKDGCASPPHEVTKQMGNLLIDYYKQCQGTNEVVLYTFQNGTHEWPLATNNDHFNATDAIWEFFANHPKP